MNDKLFWGLIDLIDSLPENHSLDLVSFAYGYARARGVSDEEATYLADRVAERSSDDPAAAGEAAARADAQLHLHLQNAKEQIIRTAEEAHVRFPQYARHWRGPEWKLARVLRSVKTKMGYAFAAWELVIARRCEGDWVVAYSVRNGVDTSIRSSDVEFIEKEA